MIKFDKQIRRGTKTDSKIYLHRSCKPLDQVDLENLKTSNQIELFEGNGLVDECDGMCGV